MLDLVVELSFIALFSFAIGAILEKKASPILGGRICTVFVICAGLLPILLIYLALSTSNVLSLLSFGGLYFLFAIISGVLFALAFFSFLKGIEIQQISNSIGMGRIQNLIVIIFSILVLGETLTMQEILGGIIIFAGVFFVATTKGLKFNKGLWPVVLAYILWGIYWIFLSTTIQNYKSSYAPFLVSRLASVVTILIIYLPSVRLSAQRAGRRKSSYLIPTLAIIAGVLDGTGNSIVGYLTTLGSLAISNIILAMSPLIVITIAAIVYKEHLTKLQAFGICCAIAGAIVTIL